MAQEIERKFLVKGDFKSLVVSETRVVQGYLSSNPSRTVRVRKSGDSGFLTIKGSANATGVSRFEWEHKIALKEADDLLKICESGVIEKTRFIVPEKSGLKFEIDKFFGENEGLVIAEIELPSEDFPFDKPEWIGKEVTGDNRYYNSMLIKKPYKYWDK